MQQQINANEIFGLFGFDIRAFSAGKRFVTQEDADRITDDVKEEIKKRFHQLALQLHPDKGGDGEKFKVLSNAYNMIQEKFRIMIAPPQPQIQVVVYQTYYGYSNYSGTTATGSW